MSSLVNQLKSMKISRGNENNKAPLPTVPAPAQAQGTRSTRQTAPAQRTNGAGSSKAQPLQKQAHPKRAAQTVNTQAGYVQPSQTSVNTQPAPRGVSTALNTQAGYIQPIQRSATQLSPLKRAPAAVNTQAGYVQARYIQPIQRLATQQPPLKRAPAAVNTQASYVQQTRRPGNNLQAPFAPRATQLGSTGVSGVKRKADTCVICFQYCSPTGCMKAETCQHAVCDGCLRSYFTNALEDERYTTFERIECPNQNCGATFSSELVMRNIYTAQQINNWWNTATMKTNIQNKVVCPFLDCKAIYDADVSFTKRCTFSECYECHRGYCVACQDIWHPGVVKIVDDEEAINRTLSTAKDRKWTRCPKCSQVVERKSGCITMWCRCRTEFCYRCGGLSSNHTCSNQCYMLSEAQVEELRSQMFASSSNNDTTTNKIRKIH